MTMRLTLWPQFSSNHSAGFTVVGEFDSAARADEVAEEIRFLLKTIAQFWAGLNTEEQTEWFARIRQGEVTPPEEVFRRRYNVEWARWQNGSVGGLDWLWDGLEQAQRAVNVYANFVIVEDSIETWVGQKPFDEILANLGGKVVYEVENGKDGIYWDVVFSVADDKAKAEIIQLFQDKLSECSSEWAVVEFQGALLDNSVQIHADKTTIRLGNILFDSRLPEHQHLIQFEAFLREQGAFDVQFTPVEPD